LTLWHRVCEWLKGLASIGGFIEAAWLVLIIVAIVIGGTLILGENLLEWLR
jgi:hypothetical protein